MSISAASRAVALGGVNTVILPDTPTTAITTVIDTTFAATANSRVRDNIVRIGINYHFTPDAVVAKY